MIYFLRQPAANGGILYERQTDPHQGKRKVRLQKPIKTVRELIPLFSNYKELRVLDLGCGIGCNSICIA